MTVPFLIPRLGVYLNLGTNRRYDVGFDAARALIAGGSLSHGP